MAYCLSSSAYTLCCCSEDHAPLVVPALIEGLKVEDVVVRRAAALALGQLGPHAIAAAPMLAECVVDEDAQSKPI